MCPPTAQVDGLEADSPPPSPPPPSPSWFREVRPEGVGVGREEQGEKGVVVLRPGVFLPKSVASYSCADVQGLGKDLSGNFILRVG